MFKTMK